MQCFLDVSANKPGGFHLLLDLKGRRPLLVALLPPTVKPHICAWHKLGHKLQNVCTCKLLGKYCKGQKILLNTHKNKQIKPGLPLLGFSASH